MNNLIVLAAFWNEREWVETSLKQIDSLSPKEVIISEGTFDSRYPVHSTDGTKEIIQKYAAKRPHVKIVKPVRASIPLALQGFWKGHRYNNNKLSRFRTMLKVFSMNRYRVNQALTFNKMIDSCETWQPGGWFMTYDCDQFYTDEAIRNILSIVNDESDYGQLVAQERTFLTNFSEFTPNYEKRNFNNMPHRIYPNTFIIPTRGLVLEQGMGFKYYHEIVEAKSVGFYNHYKIKLGNRLEQTYMVGDRKKPDFLQYSLEPYSLPHPKLIEEFLKKRDE